MMHIGLGWIYLPYSTAFTLLFPILFFVSGAVTYNSFMSGHSSAIFLLRRLCLILIPYALFMMALLPILVALAMLQERDVHVNWFSIFVVRPMTRELGVHLGHIWFLQALVVITVVSIPIFALLRGTKLAGIALFAIGCLFIAANAISPAPLQNDLKFFGVNFYLGAANLYFFSLGVIFITHPHYFQRTWLLGAAVSMLLLFGVLLGVSGNLQFNQHRNTVSLVYVSGASFGICLALYLKPLVMRLVASELGKLAANCLNFLNKHAFSVFLIHIPILSFVEYLVDDLIGVRGGLRLLLIPLNTVVFSVATAPVLTFLTKLLSTRVDAFLKRVDRVEVKTT